jgi:plastocyanin
MNPTVRIGVGCFILGAVLTSMLLIFHPMRPLVAAQTAAAVPAADLKPVYVHMDGANAFVESMVAVYPGEPVIFVNEDTGDHMVNGYNPLTGKPDNAINSGMLMGTPGPKKGVHTYKVTLSRQGIYNYYCPVHAILSKIYHHSVQPAHRPGVHGFPGAMAGTIIVTTDPALIAQNPPSSKKKILSDYFGG